MKNVLFILNEDSMDKIYSAEHIKKIEKHANILAPCMSPEQILDNPEVLSKCNIIMSGWGGPCIDKEFLDAAPDLEAVFYGAGSIRGIVSREFWEKDLIITSSWTANAVPVAEYTFAQIILCLKNTYNLNKLYTKEYYINAKKSENQKAIFNEMHSKRRAYGAYGTTVGIISLGMIGRLVCKLLQNLDVEIIAYDPFISDEEAEKLGVKPVELEEAFKTSHVISLHTPWLPETENMITYKHFSMMLERASFINTARGAIVNETDMIRALRDRPDITAVLDVTYPEPPEADSELFSLQNVFLTPHIAGSMDKECLRMGEYAVDEMIRYIKGENLKFRITKDQFENMA